jgi:hypothetical protein
VQIGLTAYDVPAREFLDLAAAADEAGFSSLWLGEHVVLPIGYSTEHPTKVQPGRQHHTGPIVSPDTELVDPLVQLGAAAAVTTCITLATGIFILPLRHPLAVARSACTVHELSGGGSGSGSASVGWRSSTRSTCPSPSVSRSCDRPPVRRRGLRRGPDLDGSAVGCGRTARGQARGDVRRRRVAGDRTHLNRRLLAARHTVARGVASPATPGRQRKTHPRRSGSSRWSAVTMYMSLRSGPPKATLVTAFAGTGI